MVHAENKLEWCINKAKKEGEQVEKETINNFTLHVQ